MSELQKFRWWMKMYSADSIKTHRPENEIMLNECVIQSKFWTQELLSHYYDSTQKVGWEEEKCKQSHRIQYSSFHRRWMCEKPMILFLWRKIFVVIFGRLLFKNMVDCLTLFWRLFVFFKRTDFRIGFCSSMSIFRMLSISKGLGQMSQLLKRIRNANVTKKKNSMKEHAYRYAFLVPHGQAHASKIEKKKKEIGTNEIELRWKSCRHRWKVAEWHRKEPGQMR